MSSEFAGGGGRTHTPLRVTDFESVASASSATPAVLFLKTPGFPDALINRSANIPAPEFHAIAELAARRRSGNQRSAASPVTVTIGP